MLMVYKDKAYSADRQARHALDFSSLPGERLGGSRSSCDFRIGFNQAAIHRTACGLPRSGTGVVRSSS